MKKKDTLIEFHRKTILEAAKKLFLEKGVSQTTMDDIAKEADYSKSTIYVYFKSKEEIYNHIVYGGMVLLKQGISESIASSDSFEECFYAICSILVSFEQKYPLYFESILGEISVSREDFLKQPILADVYRVGEEINEMLQKLVQSGIEQKRLRPDIQPLPAAFALWASICGLIFMANKKEAYLSVNMHVTKHEFLQNAFQMLLYSVLNNKQYK